MSYQYGQMVTTALASATSANGTARNGATLAINGTSVGTLSVLASCSITTASVVCTWKAQVSNDNSTWYDVKLPNNADPVATAAGTGAAVTTSLCLLIGPAVTGWQSFRIVATLSGAATAGADVTSASYVFVRYGVPTR